MGKRAFFSQMLRRVRIGFCLHEKGPALRADGTPVLSMLARCGAFPVSALGTLGQASLRSGVVGLRRRKARPITPKPSSIIAQVAGSGTAAALMSKLAALKPASAAEFPARLVMRARIASPRSGH